MSKPTQLWPGKRMREFFRAILRAEPQVDEELADRLSERLTRHINRMLVWNAKPTFARNESNVPKADDPPKKDGANRPIIEESIINEAGAPWPDADALNPPHLRPHKNKKRKKKRTPPAEAFDPYAFSTVVILARNGPDALMDKLKEIKAPQHLRQLADAQHLGIPPNIVKADELRHAIIKGASQRLADRRAAAS